MQLDDVTPPLPRQPEAPPPVARRSAPPVARPERAGAKPSTARALLVVTDVAALGTGWWIGPIRDALDRPAAVVGAVTVLLAMVVAGAYRDAVTLSALDDAPRIGVCVVLGALVGHLAVTGPTSGGPVRLVLGGLIAAGTLVIGRGICYAAVRQARRRGRLLRCGVVVGFGELSDALADVLARRPELGVAPVRRLPLGDDPPAVDVVFVVPSELFDVERRAVLARLAGTPCPSFLAVEGGEQRFFPRWAADRAWGIPLVRVASRPASSARSVKRGIDVVVSALALALLAPVMAAVALAVRIEIGPAVLFRQERIGQHGRPIVVLKFRSLPVAEARDATTRWHVGIEDPRLGRVGRLIRLTALDELPQLWNVLRGDMSLVGPRPERPYFVRRFGDEVPHYLDRHRVPVGLTGWAQVHGLRGDTSITDRARFDNGYIDQWSLWLDTKIVLRTLAHLASHVAATTHQQRTPKCP